MVVILATIASLCSCISHVNHEQKPLGAEIGSASLDVGAAGGTLSAGGVSLIIPKGAIATKASLTLNLIDEGQIPNRPQLPPWAKAVGPGLSIASTGDSIGKPVKIAMRRQALGIIPPQDRVLMAWQDDAGGWRLLPAKTESDGISSGLDHFSFGFAIRIDATEFAKARWADFLSWISARSNVKQPKCAHEAIARKGVRIVSDEGDTIKWCVGQEDGQEIVRIANNRRTYTQVSYPDGWKVKDGQSTSISVEGLARTLEGSLDNISGPRGTKTRIIDGGDVLTLIAPGGSPGHVQAQMGIVAWSINGMEFGVQTWATVAGLAPAKGAVLKDTASGSWKRIVARLSGVEEMDGYTEALRECGKGLGENVTGSWTAEVSDWAPIKSAWSCIPSLMKADIAYTGLRMFGLGIVLSAIGAVVSLAATAFNLLTNGAREIFDELASFGGKSDPIYDIRLSALRNADSRGRFLATPLPFKSIGPKDDDFLIRLLYYVAHAGIAGSDDVPCQWAEIPGWQDDSLDIFIHESDECGGDALSEFIAIRDGKVVYRVSECICPADDGNRYANVLRAYRGRSAVKVSADADEDWHYENVRI